MALWEITIGGETVEIDFDMSRMTLKESIRLEDTLGAEAFERLMDAKDVPASPRIIQALVWAKLVSTHPEIGIEDFDLDLTAIAQSDGAVVIPMKVGEEEFEVPIEATGKG